MNLFVSGNMKLGKDVACFNIPAIKTCVPTAWCKKHCYATHGHFSTFKSIREAAAKRYALSKHKDFVKNAIAELKKRKFKYVRMHVSGDFYSSNYVDKWIDIAKACPEIKFWATTKRRFNNLANLSKLPNVCLGESLDSSKPIPNHPIGLPRYGVTDDTDLSYAIAAVRKFTCRKAKVTSCTVEHCPTCNYKCWDKNSFDIITWRTKWAPGSVKKKKVLIENRNRRLASSAV